MTAGLMYLKHKFKESKDHMNRTGSRVMHTFCIRAYEIDSDYLIAKCKRETNPNNLFLENLNHNVLSYPKMKSDLFCFVKNDWIERLYDRTI